MPVNPEHYQARGKNNRGVVLRCPNLVGDRLVFFDRDSETGSWVLRDFIRELQLTHANSSLTVKEIEADADHDEKPPFHNVLKVKDWRTYLLLRTKAVFGSRDVSDALPNSNAGLWEEM